jgi:uncharacterized protein (DUF2141 family)
MNKYIYALIAFSLISSNALALISIKVRGLNTSSNDGIYRCLIFNKAAGFPGTAKNAIQSVNGEIANREGLCIFTNLNPGVYAVSTFHDENSNAKLDTNFLGIPKENYGFSNNASQPFGPPSFEEAAFEVKVNSIVTIKLK